MKAVFVLALVLGVAQAIPDFKDFGEKDAIGCNFCKIVIHALDAYLTEPGNEAQVSAYLFLNADL